MGIGAHIKLAASLYLQVPPLRSTGYVVVIDTDGMGYCEVDPEIYGDLFNYLLCECILEIKLLIFVHVTHPRLFAHVDNEPVRS